MLDPSTQLPAQPPTKAAPVEKLTPLMGQRSVRMKRKKKHVKTYALWADYAPKRSQGTINRRSRRKSRRRSLAQALRP